MKKSFAFDIPTYSLKVKLFLVGKISGKKREKKETSSWINPLSPMIFFEVAKKHGKYKKGLENGVMRVRNVFYVNLRLIMQYGCNNFTIR